ncbi:MAG: sigma-70 family RNA polymerase sigma factor [Isosphaeraceae bacterium]
MGTGPDPDGDVLSLLDALLKRSAAWRGVQTCDRDDCVQDAWLALFVEHPDWCLADPRCRAWLRSVVRNKAVDVVRRLQRHPDEPLDEQAFVSHWAESSDDPGDRETCPGSSRAELIATIVEVLNGLRDETRLILVQRGQEGRAYAEIGKELGLTTQQVRSRYNWVRHWVQERVAGAVTHACNLGAASDPSVAPEEREARKNVTRQRESRSRKSK